jgi:hypothetical protein
MLNLLFEWVKVSFQFQIDRRHLLATGNDLAAQLLTLSLFQPLAQQ